MEFRGLHEDDEEDEQKYFEFGAHFKYKELVQSLKYLQDSQNFKNEKEKENSININTNTNYNEVYNQINKQLCQKMTDIIPPNKFIQSRNIKPLIQSLSQKLTDIIQSQNNKKPMRHYVTKKRQISSKIKNNNEINLKKNNKNIARTNIENIKQINKNYFGLNQPYKKKEISQSRNLLNYKKPLSKNNMKNVQFNINKKSNIIPQESNHFSNVKKIQPSSKYFNNNENINQKNNEKIFGTVIENNKKINNNQNTQTVQNIILKSNINISFINNFNTTYLHKSKKKQKKIRSRNNQELSKFNNLENKIVNNNMKIDEENHNKNKNVNNITNKAQTNKGIQKKKPLLSPNLKNKENNNGCMTKKIVTNQNIKINQNKINNFINKDKQEKTSITGINKIKNSSGINKNNKNDSNNNKKLMFNLIGKVKLQM